MSGYAEQGESSTLCHARKGIKIGQHEGLNSAFFQLVFLKPSFVVDGTRNVLPKLIHSGRFNWRQHPVTAKCFP
jgi:hypothetical protein